MVPKYAKLLLLAYLIAALKKATEKSMQLNKHFKESFIMFSF